MSDSEQNNSGKPRRRGMTSVMLGWIAERLRRADEIKKQVSDGTYRIETDKVAASLTNQDSKN